jgi:hypothetical protein
MRFGQQPIEALKPARGHGWRTIAEPQGRDCRNGGVHRLHMIGQGHVACYVCKRPMPVPAYRGGPPAMIEVRHPLSEQVRAEQPSGPYFQTRRIGE